jgi:hypothetical protein
VSADPEQRTWRCPRCAKEATQPATVPATAHRCPTTGVFVDFELVEEDARGPTSGEELRAHARGGEA